MSNRNRLSWLRRMGRVALPVAQQVLLPDEVPGDLGDTLVEHAQAMWGVRGALLQRLMATVYVLIGQGFPPMQALQSAARQLNLRPRQASLLRPGMSDAQVRQYQQRQLQRGRRPGQNPQMRNRRQRELEMELEGAEYTIIGADDRLLVANTTIAPYRYICKLEMVFLDPVSGAPKNFIGSGVLVGTNKVLTAAHCMFDRHGGSGFAQQIRVIPGKNGPGRSRREEPFGSALSISLDVPTSWKTLANDRTAMSFDYGVITLDRPLGTFVGFLQSISAPSDYFLYQNPMHTSGYPGDKGGNNQYRVFNRNVRLFPQRIEYLQDVMGGQSGSPMWIRWEETRTIVGIVTTHDDPLTATVANTGVRITNSVLNDLRRWGVTVTPGLDRPTLRRGATGPMVKNLQARLNVWLTTPPRTGPTLTVDGNFGQNTERAVRDYQGARGLTVDGVVGAQTWGSLLATPETESEMEAELETQATTAPTSRRVTVNLSQRDRATLSQALRRQGLHTTPGQRLPRPQLRQRRRLIRQFMRSRATGQPSPTSVRPQPMRQPPSRLRPVRRPAHRPARRPIRGVGRRPPARELEMELMG